MTQEQTVNPNPDDPANVKATPAAVAHATDIGVDITKVQGTGAGGQITKDDVQSNADELLAAEAARKDTVFVSVCDNCGFTTAKTGDAAMSNCPACGGEVSTTP